MALGADAAEGLSVDRSDPYPHSFWLLTSGRRANSFSHSL